MTDTSKSHEYKCPVNGVACEVIDNIADSVVDIATNERHVGREVAVNLPPDDKRKIWENLISEIVPLLPCHLCRGCEKAAADLPAVRLGKHERRLLRLASESDDPVLVLSAAQQDRMNYVGSNNISEIWEFMVQDKSGQESTLRAMRKLKRAELIWVWETKVPTRYHVAQAANSTNRDQAADADLWRRAIVLSPLGKAVVKLLEDTLDGNKPIRWDQHITPAIDTARLTTSALKNILADDIQVEINKTMETMKFLAMFSPYAKTDEDYKGDTDKLKKNWKTWSRLSAVHKIISAQNVEQNASIHLVQIAEQKYHQDQRE